MKFAVVKSENNNNADISIKNRTEAIYVTHSKKVFAEVPKKREDKNETQESYCNMSLI